MKDDRIYLQHIRDCTHRIETYSSDGQEAFFGSELIQDAVVRNLQTHAESAKRISDEIKTAHPEVDWRAVAGIRNVLVHDYLGIDLKRIWDIVSAQLPVLGRRIEAIRYSRYGTE